MFAGHPHGSGLLEESMVRCFKARVTGRGHHVVLPGTSHWITTRLATIRFSPVPRNFPMWKSARWHQISGQPIKGCDVIICPAGPLGSVACRTLCRSGTSTKASFAASQIGGCRPAQCTGIGPDSSPNDPLNNSRKRQLCTAARARGCAGRLRPLRDAPTSFKTLLLTAL